jgi:hypothetical protein
MASMVSGRGASLQGYLNEIDRLHHEATHQGRNRDVVE